MSGRVDPEEFLDLLYAAPLEPRLWERVLERLTDLVDGHAANMTRLHLQDPTASSGLTARVDPATMERFFAHYAYINPLHTFDESEAYVRSWTPTVYRVEDVFDQDAYVRTEYFNDFIRPIEADWMLIIRLGLQDRAVSSIGLGRPGSKGAFSEAELDGLRRVQPHLIRAYRMTERLADVHAHVRGLTAGMAQAREAMFILDVEGRIRWLNAAAETLLTGPAELCAPNRRLRGSTPRVAGQLEALIGRAAGAPYVGGSMPLPSAGRSRPSWVTVTPVRPEHPALFTDPRSVLVCVSDASAGRPSTEWLADSFGLTPAEIRVAMALFDGLDPAEAAAHFGVSRNTVRVQLASIFAKTGARRQADLMRVLAGAAGS